MKKFICVVLLLCCVGMLLTLAACTPADDGELSLFNEDGTFRYKLIRPDTNSTVIKKSFVELRKTIDEKFNVSVEFEDDWADVREYEILVGLTNRPESEQVAQGLGEYTYKIEVVGKKIVIVGKDDKATAAGVQYFMETYYYLIR